MYILNISLIAYQAKCGPLFIYLFGVLHLFQQCTGHITTGSFVVTGNQYIQLVKVLYCKLLIISKQLPTFPHEDQGLNRRPQRWEASVLPLRHCGLMWPSRVGGCGIVCSEKLFCVQVFIILSDHNSVCTGLHVHMSLRDINRNQQQQCTKYYV